MKTGIASVGIVNASIPRTACLLAVCLASLAVRLASLVNVVHEHAAACSGAQHARALLGACMHACPAIHLGPAPSRHHILVPNNSRLLLLGRRQTNHISRHHTIYGRPGFTHPSPRAHQPCMESPTDPCVYVICKIQTKKNI